MLKATLLLYRFDCLLYVSYTLIRTIYNSILVLVKKIPSLLTLILPDKLRIQLIQMTQHFPIILPGEKIAGILKRISGDLVVFILDAGHNQPEMRMIVMGIDQE